MSGSGKTAMGHLGFFGIGMDSAQLWRLYGAPERGKPLGFQAKWLPESAKMPCKPNLSASLSFIEGP